ncbi:MAG: cytochrome-c peroxidase [Flavisolibacter sp.]
MKRWLVISVLLLVVLTGAILLDSCKKSLGLATPHPLQFTVPPGFPPPVYSFQNNPLTEEGFLLGRKLFYDGRLSIDGNYPCASCHQPVAAFTTFEHDRSHGYNHSHTLRNAPGLFNLAWYPVYTQDGSTQSLETIYINHITNPNEMAETIPDVISKLKKDTAYKRMFREAFGDETINPDRLYRALSQFVINLVSADSKFDRVLQGKESFTPEEQSGYNTFLDKCTGCHSGALLTDFAYRNVGLPIDPNLKDYGRMRVSGNPDDSLKFRTPSLRNVELTSYYEHDGRFTLPRDVLRHYEKGVQSGPTLDPAMQNGIPLTISEENNLVFFLRTLSDSSFLNNPRFRE